MQHNDDERSETSNKSAVEQEEEDVTHPAPLASMKGLMGPNLLPVKERRVLGAAQGQKVKGLGFRVWGLGFRV
jgi:hypothetical protein